jgi:DNA-binding transcriptional ArsR family regulator
MQHAHRTAELLRALAHPVRLQALDAVSSGFADVYSIADWTGESAFAIESHLDALVAVDLVRREGRRMMRRSTLDRFSMTETGALALDQVRRLAEALHDAQRRTEASATITGGRAPRG